MFAIAKNDDGFPEIIQTEQKIIIPFKYCFLIKILDNR